MRVTGIDKQVVGQMAAEIRSVRPPDKYKGKGIRYAGEIIKLKPGKAGKAVGRSEKWVQVSQKRSRKEAPQGQGQGRRDHRQAASLCLPQRQ